MMYKKLLANADIREAFEIYILTLEFFLKNV